MGPSSGSSGRQQGGSGQKSRWAYLLPLAAAAVLSGEASCDGDDDADEDEEVSFVRPECVPIPHEA